MSGRTSLSLLQIRPARHPKRLLPVGATEANEFIEIRTFAQVVKWHAPDAGIPNQMKTPRLCTHGRGVVCAVIIAQGGMRHWAATNIAGDSIGRKEVAWRLVKNHFQTHSHNATSKAQLAKRTAGGMVRSNREGQNADHGTGIKIKIRNNFQIGVSQIVRL